MKKLFPLSAVLGLTLGAAHFACAQATVAQPQAFASPAVSGSYNVRLFGARGDGKTLDSPAINSAIAAAGAAAGAAGERNSQEGSIICEATVGPGG